MAKPKVLILGKLPPPYMGPAIATSILLKSNLNQEFELLHLKTNINKSVSSMGRFGLGKLFKNIGLYFQMFGKCLSKRPDLVLIPVSQTTMGFAKDSWFIWIGWLTGRKVLIQLRGSNWKNWQESSSGLTRWYTKLTCKRTKGVIVLGNNLKYLFEPLYHSDRIFVVPNGANYQFPDSGVSERTQILYLANYLPSKGFHILLEALTKLQVSNYQMNAYGAWDNMEYQTQCKKIISDHDLPVILNESVSGDEKFQALANADLFVFVPQQPEGHPWVIVEAMAAGLPIISTDQGAIIESVLDGKNGFIVAANNPDETAEKIEQLISDAELRKLMGQCSKEHYLHNFTEEKMVERLSETFRNVIG